jgi:hypothetical protein
LVEEDSDPLVARSRQAEAIRLFSDPSVDLGDRKEPVVEAHERLEETTVDPWRGGRHASSVGSGAGDKGHNNAPFPPSNTVLLGFEGPPRLAQAYDLGVAKGWERASIDLYSRPVRVERDIRREDLLAPSQDGMVLLLAACLACGVMLSVLYVLFPLLLITFAGLDLGGWLMGTVLVGAIASAIVLFVSEIRVRRDVADEL